jgi:hypothetical protein
MTYSKAKSMSKKMKAAVLRWDTSPGKVEEVARRYSADQWGECGKALVKRLEEYKLSTFGLMALVEAILYEKSGE